MHAAKLNSTLAGDLPNLSATTEKLWTADDVCHYIDALNSTLSGDMNGLPYIEGSPIQISTLTVYTAQDVASTDGWGSDIDADSTVPVPMAD
eukprot:3414580-Rhodomonas_salina.1